MSESALLRKICIRASELGLRLFRNQTGRYQLPDGRWISSGLCVGSSDLIGWTPIVVTPDMIGHRIAVFTAIETKAPNKTTTDEQERFLEAVASAGGYCGVAKSLDDIVSITHRRAHDFTISATSARAQHPVGDQYSAGKLTPPAERATKCGPRG